eukprot:SM000168S02598  [mRNA]  locus=s168:116210:119879:+ [translate_table: standard]
MLPPSSGRGRSPQPARRRARWALGGSRSGATGGGTPASATGTVDSFAEAADIAGSDEEPTTAAVAVTSKSATIAVVLVSRAWQAAASAIAAGPLTVAAPHGSGAAAGTEPVPLPPPITLVCGPKNTGKSTFAQLLVNSLLGRHAAVGYLETDVGQPEFTLAGCVALHVLTGPVFGLAPCHLRKPYRCYFFGDTTPKSDPKTYLRKVFALYDLFRAELYGGEGGGPQLPLVINTHGWVRGLGYDILADILQYTVPTHVVQLAGPIVAKNLPCGLLDSTATANSGGQVTGRCQHVNLQSFNAAEGTDSKRAGASEMRALRVLAQLGQAVCPGQEVLTSPLPWKEPAAFSAVAAALVQHRPYVVPTSAVRIIHLHAAAPPSESLAILNGSLVGLGVLAGTTMIDVSVETAMHTCLGIGLVRAVDPGRGELLIVTPLPLAELQRVDVLLHGRIEMPLALLHSKEYQSPYLRHNSIAAEGTGSAATKSRNNLLRWSREVA